MLYMFSIIFSSLYYITKPDAMFLKLSKVAAETSQYNLIFISDSY